MMFPRFVTFTAMGTTPTARERGRGIERYQDRGAGLYPLHGRTYHLNVPGDAGPVFYYLHDPYADRIIDSDLPVPLQNLILAVRD